MSAQIKFTQGMSAPPGGQALQGVTGVLVNAASNGPGVIITYVWTMIDVPPGSAVPLGITGGNVPSINFTPDVPGGYLLQLTTTDNLANTTSDLRAVLVPEDSVYNRIIPPFNAPGTSVNIGGQARGWAPFMEDYLHVVDRLLDVGGAAPVNGQVMTWVAANSRWEPATGAAPSGAAGGDLGGSYPSPDVLKAHGATVPAAPLLGDVGKLLKVVGAAALGYALLVNADVDAAAAIAGTKISPNFGAQNIQTTGDLAVQNAVVNGDLTVNGTTTTVNSNVVDIKDRAVHLNYAVVGGVPVPVNIAGITIERGDTGITKRDMAGIYWREGTSSWQFALNTGGDDLTVGANLPIIALGATLSGLGGSGAGLAAVSNTGALSWVSVASVVGATPMVGDVSGTAGANTVDKWKGKALDAATMGVPTDAQIPVWVNGSTAWKALTVSGDGALSNTGALSVTSLLGLAGSGTGVVGVNNAGLLAFTSYATLAGAITLVGDAAGAANANTVGHVTGVTIAGLTVTTTDGFLGANEAGAGKVRIGQWTTSNTYGAVYIGTAPGAANYTVLGDGTNAYLNAPSAGGYLYLNHGGNTTAIFAQTAVAPFATKATGVGAAAHQMLVSQDFEVRGRDSTGLLNKGVLYWFGASDALYIGGYSTGATNPTHVYTLATLTAWVQVNAVNQFKFDGANAWNQSFGLDAGHAGMWSQPWPGDAPNKHALYFGSNATAPATNNYTFLGDQTSVWFNSPGAGYINFYNQNATQLAQVDTTSWRFFTANVPGNGPQVEALHGHVVAGGTSGTNQKVHTGPRTGSETTYGAIWVLPAATARTANNPVAFSDGSDFYLNATAAGRGVYIYEAGVTQLAAFLAASISIGAGNVTSVNLRAEGVLRLRGNNAAGGVVIAGAGDVQLAAFDTVRASFFDGGTLGNGPQIEAAHGHIVAGGTSGTNFKAHAGPLTGFETSQSAAWFLPPGTARSSSNHSITGTGVITYINTPGTVWGVTSVGATFYEYSDNTQKVFWTSVFGQGPTIEAAHGHIVAGGTSGTDFKIHIGPYTGSETAGGGMWALGPATARTSTNWAFLGTVSDAYFNGPTNLYFGVGGTVRQALLTSSSLSVGFSYAAPQYVWDLSATAIQHFTSNATSATIKYDMHASGAGNLFSFLGQDAFTGSGLAGGNVLVAGGAGDGAGAHGDVRFTTATNGPVIEALHGHIVAGGTAGTNWKAHIGPYTGSETTLAALWFLAPGTARSAANPVMYGDGSETFIGAIGAAGAVRIYSNGFAAQTASFATGTTSIGGGNVGTLAFRATTAFSLRSPTVTFVDETTGNTAVTVTPTSAGATSITAAATVTSFTLNQAVHASGTGNPLYVTAQAAGGAGADGGRLHLAGGAGSGGVQGGVAVDDDLSTFGAAAANLTTSAVTRIRTTNNTQTTSLTFAHPDETTCDFVVTVIAKDEANGDTFRNDYRVTYSRTGAGAPTIQGTLAAGTAVSTGAMAGSSATIDVNSNNIRVRVTGPGAVNVRWSTILQVQAVASP